MHAWKQYLDLDMVDELAMEWSTFIKRLKHVEMMLLDQDDTLVWTWSERKRVPSTKMVYESLLEGYYVSLLTWWHPFIWKGNA